MTSEVTNMARRRRVAPGGYVYHVMNRAAGRLVLFESIGDYAAFERLLREAQSRTPMAIVAYCLMRNHWHLLLWPLHDRQLSTFMQWLESTHARRWRHAHDTIGRGAVYQSRFKSIPVQSDHHLLAVWRYVERNPLRANLVPSAANWEWSSLSSTRHRRKTPTLTMPAVNRPSNWLEYVNLPQTEAEVAAIRAATVSGVPFGDPLWSQAAQAAIGWRPLGRPKRGTTPFRDAKGSYPFSVADDAIAGED